VDEYGQFSSEEARWFEEEAEESDPYDSTSLENTPSIRSVPSMGRSTSGSSSIYPSAESSDGVEGVTSTRTYSNTTMDDEVTRLAPPKPESVPGLSGAVGPLESAGPVTVRPGLIPERSGGIGGPPPPDGRFFNNPLNLRTIMTGTGDGYRSPEPPSRRDTLSPRRHPGLDGGPPVSGLNPSEIAAEQLRQSSSVPQPAVTQPPDLGMDGGYGAPPVSSSSLVLPVELMVYNDLMVDIGTAQYLGAEMREPGPPPFAYPPMPVNGGRGVNGFGSNTNGYRWEDFPRHATHEPPQTVPSVWYPQQDQPYRGGDHTSAQHAHTGYEGQWPTSGIVDYK